MAQDVKPSAEAAPRWALVVDLDRCTGCQACVVACHAENNVPVAGEKQAIYGRWMHWIIIHRYWEGEYPNVKARFMPVMCQQCTEAPCEPVCPVFATYHNPEGLNAQIYNRCIGTRFCGNACPYKVRTFNWFQPVFPEPLTEQLNPDVTVRSRGIMEKCTFCIQRIQEAEAEGKKIGSEHKDGVVTACAQTCTGGAIYFGDLDDHSSKVHQLAESERAYRLLEDLGTEPKVYYLAEG